MIIIPMSWQDSEAQELSTYKCHVKVVDDLLDIFDGLQRYELKLANWMIMSQPRYISYWSFHLGSYEWIELDKYTYIAYYEMIEWIKCLEIKFELIWVG